MGPISGTADLELTLECLLRSISGEAPRLQKCCAAVSDWGALLIEVESHGVLGILARALTTVSPATPPNVLRDLGRRAVVQRLVQSRLQLVLDEILSTIAVAGVDALPLKGPVLGARLYGDATLRVSSDLDLMVTREQMPAATAALIGLGYQGDADREARQGWEHQYHITFHRDGAPRVELHFRLTADLGVVIPSEEFLARSQPYQAEGGTPCRILSAEDELFFLVLHAARHLFARLIWLYDVKALLNTRPDVDWQVVADRAERFRVGRAFGFAMRLIARRMEITLPEGAIRADFSRPRRAALTAILSAAGRSSGARAKILGHVFRTLLCDRPALAARYVGNHLHRVSRR